MGELSERLQTLRDACSEGIELTAYELFAIEKFPLVVEALEEIADDTQLSTLSYAIASNILSILWND